MDDTLQRQKFADLVARLAPTEGVHESPIKGLFAARGVEKTERTPVMYEPGIVFLAQGVKRGYMGNSQVEYSADTYLVLSSVVPWEVEVIEASAEKPLLCLFIPASTHLIGSVSIPLDDLAPTREFEDRKNLPKNIIATSLNVQMRDAAVRLSEALLDPIETEILGEQIVKEIIYRVLRGPQAGALRSLIGQDSVAGKITRILHDLNVNPQNPVTVTEMAEEVGMSVSAFHAAFKETTSMAPIQYQKAVRLHRAQTRIALDGVRVSEAAFEVGYASPSHFSRDYRKFFGMPPSEAADQIQITRAYG